jgi:hypothetical protein
MLTVLDGLPDNVLGLEATGEVTRDDYRETLLPAVRRQRETYGKIRLLYVLGEDYDGYTAGAMWEDEKLLDGNPFAWERIAVVTDSTSVRALVRTFGWMIPGGVRLFGADEVEQAKEWVSA